MRHSALRSMSEGRQDPVQFQIDAGEAPPKKLLAWRVPLIVRQEVAQQLKELQRAGVVQPSSSPWSSPVVMAMKKDGTHRSCVDYQHLNAVTSLTHPLQICVGRSLPSCVYQLKAKLTTAPVLSYPQLNKRLCAGNRCQCIRGLGAVLSQEGDDGLLHPVAYTSCSLSKSEANYSITELETLAVVWVVMYFHCYAMAAVSLSSQITRQ